MEQRPISIYKRDPNIDLIKIVASIAVVGLHTLDICGLICGFSVPAFILSSGYLLVRGKNVTLKKTLIRLTKVLKLVLLWNIIWLSFPQVFLSSKGWSNPWYLTLLNSVLNCFLQRGIWQFWYLGTLSILYILLFVASFVKKLTKNDYHRMIYIIWGIVFAFGAFLQAVSLICLHYPGQSLFIQTFRIWTWIQYFLMGGILYQKKEYLIACISAKTNIVFLFITTVLACANQYICGNYLLHDLHAEYFYDDIVVVCWVFVFSLFMLRLPIRKGRIISEIAKLTLGVYIIHPFLIEWYVRFITVTTLLDHIICFIVISIAAFTISFVIRKIPIIKQLVIL